MTKKKATKKPAAKKPATLGHPFKKGQELTFSEVMEFRRLQRKKWG